MANTPRNTSRLVKVPKAHLLPKHIDIPPVPVRDPTADLQLYLAAVNGDIDTAQKALDRGALSTYSYSGTSKDPKGMNRAKIELQNDTPLHCATDNNSEQLVRILLQNKADPNVNRIRTVENYGRTKAVTENSLMIAVKQAQKAPESACKIVQLLVEYNGDVRAVSIAKRDKIRSETIKAYLRYDFYALNHINHCIRTRTPIIDVSNCQISTFESFFSDAILAKLEFVTSLDLSNNKLTELPATISHLKNLNSLKLANNQLNDLPPSIAILDKLESLDLSGNPLSEIPKFIYQQGVESIRGYYSDILEGVTEVCFETKLLIVGEENVGKTALLNNIISKSRGSSSSTRVPKELPNISTHGIDTITFTLKGTMESKKFHSSGCLQETPTRRRKSQPTTSGLGRRRSTMVIPHRARNSSATHCGVVRRNSEFVDVEPQLERGLTISNFSSDIPYVQLKAEMDLIKADEKELESFLGCTIEQLFRKFSSEDKGITTKTIKRHFQTHKRCFQVNGAIDWLIANSKINLRELAVRVGELFTLHGYIRPVGSKSKKFRAHSSSYFTISGDEEITVEYHFHSYDFAGQEIYYPTHQFFLSPKAIYIVVFDLRQDLAKTRLEYWLQSIQSRAGDSGDVIIVGTHVDDECFQENENLLSEVLFQVEERFCIRFPFIKNIYGISNKSGVGVDVVRDRLVTAAQNLLRKMPPIPVKYRHLEAMLLQEREKRKNLPVLEWNQVLELGNFLDMKDRVVTRAIEFLHNRGVICFFPSLDGNDMSKQLVTLDPQWLTKCMGNMIGSGSMQSFVKRGIMRRSDLHHIWKHPMFPPSVHSYLLQILETIDVVFLIPKTGMILISCLLPDTPPVDMSDWLFDDDDELARIYHLKFFPSGFFSRIVIRTLQLRDPNIIARLHYWNTGITVKFRNGASLLIQQFIHKRNLVIRVRGISDPGLLSFCRQLFKDVLEMINLLTRYWFHLQAKRYIPCPHCVKKLRLAIRDEFTNEVLSDDPRLQYFSISECIDSAASNFPELSCRKSLQQEDVTIRINLSLLAPDLLLDTIKTTEIQTVELTNQVEIGAGAFGVVFKANYQEKEVACKKLTDIKSEAAYKEFISEVSIMADLFHQNLVNMIGYCKKPPTIVMEYIQHGNLYEHIHNFEKEISWSCRLKIALDIATALQFLHNLTPSVIHRDLKSPNVLMNSLSHLDVIAKVADFGLSTRKWMELQEENDKRDVQNPVWLAPEILDEAPYDEKVDCYALGVIMWELLARDHPFNEYNHEFTYQLEDAIRAGVRPTIPKRQATDPEQLHSKYAELMQSCWAPRSSERPCADEICLQLQELYEQSIV